MLFLGHRVPYLLRGRQPQEELMLSLKPEALTLRLGTVCAVVAVTALGDGGPAANVKVKQVSH